MIPRRIDGRKDKKDRKGRSSIIRDFRRETCRVWDDPRKKRRPCVDWRRKMKSRVIAKKGVRDARGRG